MSRNVHKNCAGKSGVTKGSSNKGTLLMGIFKNPFARESGGSAAEPYQPSNPYEINPVARKRMKHKDVRKLVRLHVVGFAFKEFGEHAFRKLTDKYGWDFNGPNTKKVLWGTVGIEFEGEDSKTANAYMHNILKDSPAHREYVRTTKKSPGNGTNSFGYLTFVELAEELDSRIPDIDVTVELLVNPNKFTVEFGKQFQIQNGGADNVLVA